MTHFCRPRRTNRRKILIDRLPYFGFISPREHRSIRNDLLTYISTFRQMLTYTRDSMRQALLENNVELAQRLENVNEEGQ